MANTNPAIVLAGNVYDVLAAQQQKGNQPLFRAEAAAMIRGTREDLFNNLIVAFPGSLNLTREQGAPGSPTSQLTTEALTGAPVDKQKDTVRRSIMGYELPKQEQTQERERGREM
jgi:hypothetical protein